MSNWDPDLYLKFKKERTQAVKDLIFRIRKEKPERILDLGCGPGNSTVELKNRWQESDITGLDNSAAMLDKAKKDYQEFNWVLADANKELTFLGKFDIVFSNAVIQWIPGHKKLLNNLFDILNPGGVLAVQTPNTSLMPIRIAIVKTASELRWQKYFEEMDGKVNYRELDYYYDILSPMANEVELWETRYNHIISNHRDIIEWYSSTGMRPYLERLDEKQQEEFKESVLTKIKKDYKTQQNGFVLFPFRRLFFIAYK